MKLHTMWTTAYGFAILKRPPAFIPLVAVRGDWLCVLVYQDGTLVGNPGLRMIAGRFS